MTKPTPDRSGNLLASLARLSAKTDAATKSIHQAAQARLIEVTKQLEELAPTVLTRPGAEDQYKALTLEVHKLNVVIAQSR